MSNKLKPCPFCGTNAVIQSTLRRHDFDDAIECDDDTCGVFLTACPPRGNLTKGQLIEKWNTRADDKRIAELEAENAQLKAEKEKLRGNALLLYRLGIGVGNGTPDCKAEAKKILAEIGKELNDD